MLTQLTQRGRGKAAAIAVRYVGSFGPSARLGLQVLLGVTLFAVTGLAGAEPQAQASSPVPTSNLHRAEVIRFNAPGPAAVTSKIKCSTGGDIYAIYSNTPPLEIWSAPIRRVSMASRSVTEYPVPAIPGYEKLARLGFDVAANGTLYALLRANPQSGSKSKSDPVYLIAKYKDDGSLNSYFAIGQVPGKDVHPSSLAVFADQSFLVSGTTTEKTSDGTSLGVFSAIFDPNGVFRAPVTLMKLDSRSESMGSHDPPAAPPRTIHQEAVEKGKHATNAVPLASSLHSFSSSDGYIYVFQEDGRLDLVSPVGSVEHEFKLKSPVGGLSGLHMAAAGLGFLFVFYDHVSTGELDENRGMITVVYPQTGEVTAAYRMPQAETDFSVSACAASPKDFTFLSSDAQGYLEVVHYLPD